MPEPKYPRAMLQAIVTRYLGPTNHRGSRVAVRAAAGRKFYGWNCALNSEDNHGAAAMMFAAEMGWLEGYTLIGGGMPDQTGNCYVLVRKGSTIEC